MRSLFFLAFLTASSWAKPGTAAEWVAELRAAHQALHGYLATYRSEADGGTKTLDATLAYDAESGLSYLKFKATHRKQTTEGRFWNTLNGDLFIDAMGQRAYYPTLNPEFEPLLELFPKNAHLKPAVIPGLLLDRSNLQASYQWATHPGPNWIAATEKEATLGEVTASTVAFHTRHHGELTIDRKTGLLKRQSLLGENGQLRIFEQVSYQPDPGKEAILGVTAQWQLAGAETLQQTGQLAALRHSIFQQLITAIDDKEFPQNEASTWVRDKALPLRRLAAAALRDQPESVFRKTDWKTQLAQITASHQADEASKESLRLAATRSEIAADHAKIWVTTSKGRNAVRTAIFGKNPPLEARTRAGESAVDQIEEALARALFEAALFPVMSELWGEPKE
jgi:hypothetical protein